MSNGKTIDDIAVAPYAGAWIEIVNKEEKGYGLEVAPYAGAWIEIITVNTEHTTHPSLPTRERGLKWQGEPGNSPYSCRSLRGSVD